MGSKCLKHTPGKKSSAGDKPATRKHVAGLDLSRLPLVRGVHTVADFKSQAATVSPFHHTDQLLMISSYSFLRRMGLLVIVKLLVIIVDHDLKLVVVVYSQDQLMR